MDSEIRMLDIRQVMAITGLGRTTVYRMVKNGDFPTPRQLGPRKFAWFNTDIESYLDSLPPVSYAKLAKLTGEVTPS